MLDTSTVVYCSVCNLHCNLHCKGLLSTACGVSDLLDTYITCWMLQPNKSNNRLTLPRCFFFCFFLFLFFLSSVTRAIFCILRYIRTVSAGVPGPLHSPPLLLFFFLNPQHVCRTKQTFQSRPLRGHWQLPEQPLWAEPAVSFNTNTINASPKFVQYLEYIALQEQSVNAADLQRPNLSMRTSDQIYLTACQTLCRQACPVITWRHRNSRVHSSRRPLNPQQLAHPR